MEPDNLQHVLDNALAEIGQAREAFSPRLAPREVGTITSIATGIAMVSGLPGVKNAAVVLTAHKDAPSTPAPAPAAAGGGSPAGA